MATKLGCNTIIFEGEDVETALQHLAWLEYDGAELAAVPSMVDHVPIGEPEKLRAIRHRADDLGLGLFAIEIGWPDPKRSEPTIEAAAELGVPIVNAGSGGKSDDEESFKQTVDRFAQLAEVAGRCGVTLGVKPHIHFAVYNTATLQRLVREVDSPHVRINFDPSHIYRADEDPVESARQLARLSCGAHIRDCPSRARQSARAEAQVPGRGVIDLPGTLRALLESGFAGNLDVEIHHAGTKGEHYSLSRNMGMAAEARGYLRRCLQEIGQP
jgi:sugar phosphate isomerase/epimerase